MENLENNEMKVTEEAKSSSLNTVTPFSKYVAMALFVALPFLGGWIGYSYAPEKIVEVERIVIKEVEPISNTELQAITPTEPSYTISSSSEESNWQTYQSSRYNFELSSPNSFVIDENELDSVSTIISFTSTNPDVEIYILPNGGADYGLEGVEFTSDEIQISGNTETKYTTFLEDGYRELVYISSSSIPTSWNNLNCIEVRGEQDQLTDVILSTFNFIN